MLGRIFGGAISRSRTGPSVPDVSVVVPLYNHAAYVREAIDSVLAERGHVQDVIVVDDGSTDDSLAVVRSRADNDSRVIVWTQPNRGAHATLNAGMARATGRYVAILNSDDLFLPGRLAKLCNILDEDDTLWMATSGVRFVDKLGQRVSNAWYDTASEFAATNADLGTSLLNGNVFVSTSNYVIRRDVLDRIAPFAPLRYAHDLELALRILISGGRIGRSNDILLQYRMHDSNTIDEDHSRVRREWAMAAGFYLAGLKRGSSSVSQWQRLSHLIAVLERHKILQGAVLCASYLTQGVGSTIAQSGMTTDIAFLNTLSGLV